MLAKGKRTLAAADAAIRQARRDIDWLAALPAQAAQAVLKTYFQAWKNCWDGRAAPAYDHAEITSVAASHTAYELTTIMSRHIARQKQEKAAQ